MDKIETAQKSGDKDQETILRAHLETNNENLINNDIASEKSGTATARGLAARRMAMAEDYSLDRMLQRVRINNDGKVPDEARKQIIALTKQLEGAQNKLETHQEETAKKQAEEKVGEIRKQITKESGKVPGLKNGKISDKTQETKKKVSDFFNGLKIKSDGALNSSIIPPQLWNAFVETIKQSVLAGVEINAAIQKGVEYLKGKKLDDNDIANAKSEFSISVGLEKETKKDKAYLSVKEKLAEHEADSDKLKAISAELLKLAKEHIRDGMSKMDDIVDAIHEKILPDFKGLTKREVRDAISGYGKTLELNKDEVEKQLRELKAQARLISGLEDIDNGKAPLRSGLQRDEQSDAVRNLRKLVEVNMRNAGIEITPKDITKQFKTALDTIKRRLENQITDMNKAIDNGDKIPKSKGVEYDDQANVLKKERDNLKEVYDKVFGVENKELTDEQRIKMTSKALEKSIKEYERKIDKEDFRPKDKKAQVTTPELEVLRVTRDELRKSYNDLIPDEIVYKARIEKFSKNLDKRQVALQERIDTVDFDPRPKREALLLDNRLTAKKAAVEKTKRQLDRLIEDFRLKNRGKLEKTLDTINKIRRSILLSSVSTILKLGSAAMQRPINNIAEGVVGSLLHYPLHSISSKAPSEGGILKIGNEANALYDFISKDTFKESWAIIKEGLPTDMDALHAKKLEAMKGFLELPGRTHKALKNPVKKYAYKRAFLNRAEFYAKQGEDIHDPKVIAKIDIESYNDAERAIFMQENIVTKAINNNLMYWEKSGDAGKVLAASVRFLLPIIKIPSNFVAETSSYYLGAAKAGIALRNGVQSLKPEQADYVYRALKKQGVGAAVFTLGYFSAASVGGFYTGKRDEADLKAGDVVAFGMHLPYWLSHTPLWTLLHAGATFKRLEDEASDQTQDDNDGNEIPKEWLGNAFKITLKSTIDNLPFVQTPAKIYDAMKKTGSLSNMTGDLAKSFFLPPDVQKVANYFDQGEDGETRKVEAKGFWKRMQMGVPFLRNSLETKN